MILRNDLVKLKSMKINHLFVGLGMFASLFALEVKAATELARVNNTVITLEDFNKKYQALLPMYQNKVPTKATVLDDLVKRELGIQEAKKMKLDQDPEIVEEMNTALYQAFLRKSLSKEFEKIAVTDTDAKAFYQSNPEVRTSHIFVQLPPGATKEAQQDALKRIQEIQKELRSGKSFAEVAQKFSEGVAAPMGGDLDFQTKDKLDPDYYKAAKGLGSPGNVSGIVKTQFGYHIIKLTAIRSWNDADRAMVKQLLIGEKRQQIFDRYMAGLKSKSRVSIKASLIN